MSLESLDRSRADAVLLTEVDDALSGRPTGGSSGLWTSIARAIPSADDAFRARLRMQLAAPQLIARRTTLRPLSAAARARRLGGMRRLLFAAALLVLLAVPVGIAVAQGGLSNVIPVFLRQPIDGLVLVKTPLMKAQSDADLQRLMSFALWLPSDVPCAGPNQRTYDSTSRTATLVYQCVSVSERSSETTFRPAVDAGSLEDVTINGLPGYYYQSTVVMPTSGEKQTNAGVLLERDGTIITVFALPEPRADGSWRVLGKTDLIRIAASMTRARAE